MTSLTAWDQTSPTSTPVGQTTAYIYGVTTAAGDGVNSNDIAAVTEYPDPTTGSASSASNQEETVTVDAMGQVQTSTDRNGTSHRYSYDPLGRMTLDQVTALGSGVDVSVMSEGTTYDAQGNVTRIRVAKPGGLWGKFPKLP